MITVDEGSCVLCGLCTGVCPPDSLELGPDRLIVKESCTDCGWCVPYCPVGALSGGRPVRGRRRPEVDPPAATGSL